MKNRVRKKANELIEVFGFEKALDIAETMLEAANDLNCDILFWENVKANISIRELIAINQ